MRLLFLFELILAFTLSLHDAVFPRSSYAKRAIYRSLKFGANVCCPIPKVTSQGPARHTHAASALAAFPPLPSHELVER